MFGSIIIFIVGIVIGIYVSSQIEKHVGYSSSNKDLLNNINKWESSHKVNYSYGKRTKKTTNKGEGA